LFGLGNWDKEAYSNKGMLGSDKAQSSKVKGHQSWKGRRRIQHTEDRRQNNNKGQQTKDKKLEGRRMVKWEKAKGNKEHRAIDSIELFGLIASGRGDYLFALRPRTVKIIRV
jgi:hypothetical protein